MGDVEQRRDGGRVLHKNEDPHERFQRRRPTAGRAGSHPVQYAGDAVGEHLMATPAQFPQPGTGPRRPLGSSHGNSWRIGGSQRPDCDPPHCTPAYSP